MDNSSCVLVIFLLTAKPAPPAEPSPDQYMISPITGEKIPAHKVPEHMRIGE